MPTLYELSDDLHRLQVALDEMELTPEDQAAALDAFLGSADDLKHKLDGYACLLREYETTAAGRKAEADRLSALAKSDTARAKALKDRLCWFFETHELDKVKTERFAFTLANNGGKQALMLPDIEAIDEEFVDMVPTIIAERVRTALEAGREVPGAHIMPRGKHILIR